MPNPQSTAKPRTAEAQQPPLVAMQFLLFLGRAEAAAGGRGSFWEVDDGEDATADDTEIWRAKLHSYEATLRSQLTHWKGLPDVAKERYRSRIEDILPALERTLEQRRKAAEVDLSPPEELESPSEAAGNADQAVVAAAAAAAGAAVAAAAAAAEAPPLAGGLTVLEADSAMIGAPGLRGRGAAAGQTEPPWRRKRGPGGAASRGGDGADVTKELGRLEDEMVDMSHGMKEASNSILHNLKQDHAVLESIADKQDKGITDVQKQTEKGKKLLWSSSLGFICTMVMLIISIVIFFMMIPFIFFT